MERVGEVRIETSRVKTTELRVEGGNPVTEGKGRAQSTHTLCPYLNQHGDARRVKKGQPAAVQDYGARPLLWAGL